MEEGDRHRAGRAPEAVPQSDTLMLVRRSPTYSWFMPPKRSFCESAGMPVTASSLSLMCDCVSVSKMSIYTTLARTAPPTESKHTSSHHPAAGGVGGGAGYLLLSLLALCRA